MYHLRHLPPQFLLPGWAIRQLRRKIWFSVSSGGAYSTKPKIPLLHELFPEEAEAEAKASEAAEKSNGRSGTGQERHIPRLPLETDFGQRAADQGRSFAAQARTTENTPKAGKDQWCVRQPGLTVAVLSNASKSLAKTDFLRLIPRGRHIESWTENGRFITVIPGRDPNTLQPLGHYFLLFPSLSSAMAYKERIFRLHSLAAVHTPSSLLSPLPPPPDYLMDDQYGEDVHRLLQAYSLMPSSQKMSWKIVKEPYPRRLQQLIDNAGDPRLAGPARRVKSTVLLSVEGVHLSTYAVETAIARDGRERSLPWETWGEHFVSTLNSPILSSMEGETDENTEGLAHGQVKATSSRWLVSLVDEIEAKRFVRVWHQRAFPMPQDMLARNDPPPIVKAELVW